MKYTLTVWKTLLLDVFFFLKVLIIVTRNPTILSARRYRVYFCGKQRFTKPLPFLTLGGRRRGGEQGGKGWDFFQNTCLNDNSEWGKD